MGRRTDSPSTSSSLSGMIALRQKADSSASATGRASASVSEGITSGGGVYKGEPSLLSLKIGDNEDGAVFSGSKQAKTPRHLSYQLVFLSGSTFHDYCGGQVESVHGTEICAAPISSCRYATHKKNKHAMWTASRVFIQGTTSTGVSRFIVPYEFHYVVPHESTVSEIEHLHKCLDRSNARLKDTVDVEMATDVFNQFVENVIGRGRPDFVSEGSLKPAAVEVKNAFFNSGLESVSGDEDSDGEGAGKLNMEVMSMMGHFENLLKQQAQTISFLSVEVSRLKTQDVSTKIEDLSDKLMETQDDFKHLDTKFNNNISTLREVPALKARIDHLSLNSGSNTMDEDDFKVLQNDVNKIHLSLDVLDRRSQSEYLDFDDIQLPSLRDTFLWVNDNVASSSFSCFYDFISLLDSIGNVDVEEGDFVRAEHDAMKAKFMSTAEVSISASFKHVAPMAFSRKDQDDVAVLGSIERSLPKVKKREYWVSLGGRHGLKKSLSKDVEGQVSSIRKLIKGTLGASEGAKLAYIFLEKTLECWRTFMAWTEDFYQELIGTSAVEPKEAWSLILQCWMGFFEDIRDIRRDVASLKASGLEVGSVARKELVGHYIWTTGRVIKLQEEYCAKNFRNHPTIAGVINFHLFEHRLPTSVHNHHVKRFDKLEKEFNNLKAEVTRKLKKVSD